MDKYEGRLRVKLNDAIRQCKDLGYPPNRFVQMLRDESAVGVVRKLLKEGPPSLGFEELSLYNRLDLSVEAIALQSPWNEHFTPDELQRARERLAARGFALANNSN